MIMPMQLLFLQDRYFYPQGLIDLEKWFDYAREFFKWKIIVGLRKMEHYLLVEIWLLIALQKSENAER